MPSSIPEAIKKKIQQNSNPSAIKDRNSIFLCANSSYAHLVGLKHHQDFVGRTDFDTPCGLSHCAHLFRAQDQEILTTQSKMRVLDIHPFAHEEWKAHICTKTPYFTSEGELQGVFFYAEEITHHSILEFGAILARTSLNSEVNPLVGQNSYLLGSLPKTPITLSPRQKEVLFFLVRGHSLKHIAATLNVTISTIGEHVDKLKEKFNALTKKDVIEKAIAQGFSSLIPSSLRIKQMSIALLEFESCS